MDCFELFCKLVKLKLYVIFLYAKKIRDCFKPLLETWTTFQYYFITCQLLENLLIRSQQFNQYFWLEEEYLGKTLDRVCCMIFHINVNEIMILPNTIKFIRIKMLKTQLSFSAVWYKILAITINNSEYWSAFYTENTTQQDPNRNCNVLIAV